MISETKGGLSWLEKLRVRRKKRGNEKWKQNEGRVACVCKVVPKDLERRTENEERTAGERMEEMAREESENLDGG